MVSIVIGKRKEREDWFMKTRMYLVDPDSLEKGVCWECFYMNQKTLTATNCPLNEKGDFICLEKSEENILPVWKEREIDES